LARWKYFVLGGVIVPPSDHLLGIGIVQGGEGLIGELAKEVPGAIDFKRVKLAVGSHVIRA
jgi:hypothetical protein